MKPTSSALAGLLLLLTSSCGRDWGTELSQTTPQGQATLYHTAAVEEGLAREVLQAMVDANYNFASNLPEQLDRVDGRLTLRLGNDNEDTMREIEAQGEAQGTVHYMHGMARHLSSAIGGEPVDVVLCRATLDQPFYTVSWQEQE